MKTPEEIIDDAAILRPGKFAQMPSKAIMEALDAAGYLIVPKEPTEEMLQACLPFAMDPSRPSLMYKAMIAAKP